MKSSPKSRRFTFLCLLLFCFFVLAGCAAQLFGQTNDGKLMIQRFNDDGPATVYFVTPENNKAIGINGSGVPAMLSVGGSSSFGGLSDVALTGLANGDLLQYNSATSKWNNITKASALGDYLTAATAATTYAPLAHNQAWSTITSTPTTLAGYGITDGLTETAANLLYQPLSANLTALSAYPANTDFVNPDTDSVVIYSGSGNIPAQGITIVDVTDLDSFGDILNGGGRLTLRQTSGLSGFSQILQFPIRTAISQNGTISIPNRNGTMAVSATSPIVVNATTGNVTLADGDRGSLTVSATGATWTIDASAVTDSMLAGSITPSKITGTAAILGANTFTALQTVTQGSANAGIFASTGYSLTGSNATNMIDLAGTWNTTGSPAALQINMTNTASGTSTRLIDLQTSGTSRLNYNLSDGYLKLKNNDTYAEWGGVQGGAMSWRLYGQASMQLFAGGYLNLPSTTGIYSINTDTIWRRAAAATWQSGTDHATAATNQRMKSHNVTTGTGAALDIAGGTGSVAGGAVTISTATTTTITERVRVSATGEVFLNLPTSAGTTGSLWNDGGTVKVAP